MKTKKPSAIVYGWYKTGTELLQSEIYWEEGLFEDVVVYALDNPNNVFQDYSKYEPDVIISFGEYLEMPTPQLQRLYRHYPEPFNDAVLANVIVCQSVFDAVKNTRPKFSIFTPTFKTGERVFRAYYSLKNQTFKDWEWVVVDDSPDDETWQLLQKIAAEDFRVKIHKLYPLSGGNVGLAKHRAAVLADGEWLVELDHDDELTTECLETSLKAIEKYPDAGFLYTNCCEMYDDGEMKYYDHDWTGNWYGRHDNYFDFGYAGHSWVHVDGKELLAHHYPDINPLTIRFNISMPNHCRMWRRDVYQKIGGHNKKIPVADDFEIIERTFLATKFIHVKKVLYLQYNNRNSTTDNNSLDINRRARLIRDYNDVAIHNRIIELGFEDWNWDEERNHSIKFQNSPINKKFHEEEQVMNYIYE